MMFCAAATSSPARAGAAKPISKATSKTKARMTKLSQLVAVGELRPVAKDPPAPTGVLAASPSHAPQVFPGCRIAQGRGFLVPLPGCGDIAGYAVAILV